MKRQFDNISLNSSQSSAKKLPYKKQQKNNIDEIIVNEDSNEFPDDILAFQYAESGNTNSLLNLLRKKPELLNKFSSTKGELPLITCASSNGHLKTLQMLIKQGSDINIKSGPFGLTPIQFAAMNSHLMIIKELINSGADVNLLTEDGISGENNGMDKQFFVKGGGSLLHIAADFASYDICKMILEHDSSSLDIPDSNNITPLFYAVVRMNLSNVILLLDWNQSNRNINLIASYDVKTEDGIIQINAGETMLHCACKRINRRGYENDPSAVSIIKLLIKNGADINIKDKNNRKPINYIPKSYLKKNRLEKELYSLYDDYKKLKINDNDPSSLLKTITLPRINDETSLESSITLNILKLEELDEDKNNNENKIQNEIRKNIYNKFVVPLSSPSTPSTPSCESSSDSELSTSPSSSSSSSIASLSPIETYFKLKSSSTKHTNSRDSLNTQSLQKNLLNNNNNNSNSSKNSDHDDNERGSDINNDDNSILQNQILNQSSLDMISIKIESKHNSQHFFVPNGTVVSFQYTLPSGEIVSSLFGPSINN